MGGLWPAPGIRGWTWVFGARLAPGRPGGRRARRLHFASATTPKIYLESPRGSHKCLLPAHYRLKREWDAAGNPDYAPARAGPAPSFSRVGFFP